MMVTAIVFSKLQTVKILVRHLCKKRPFRQSFGRQHVEVSQILAKCPSQHIYHVCSSFWGKLILKLSPLVLGEVLVMFLNTLSADRKYPIEDWENLQLQIQMQLSQKQKLFSQFFFRFLKSTSNFKRFERKDHGHS